LPKRVYRSIAPLYEGRRSVLFRGETDAGEPVLIKQLRGLYPEPTDVAWSRREFDILRSAAVPGVLAARDHTAEEGRVSLVLEHFDGARLVDLFATERPSVSEVLDVAREVATALTHLHGRGILHKAISPAAVLWNRATREARLIELGSASTASREGAPTSPPADADLHFIAPELTGRANRAVDHRSDYYALGCVLYWLLTGQPPFTSDDPLDLIHAQVARQAVRPSERTAGVPVGLSRLVMTLLAKRAEDRYQSGDGLLADLAACRGLAEDTDFAPRARDVARTFRISDRLYGRGPELDLVAAACERMAHGACELLLVTGQPGIGKTVLVHEVLEPTTRHHANLVAGKFDQVNRDVPYASLVQALRQLLLHILGGSPEEVRRWRQRLQHAVGDGGRALTDLIGELELVIGPQPPLEQVPPEDARRRLDLVFRRFMRALAAAEHPVILFLDDLQWADLASLRLVEALVVDPEVTHLLVIGAYRDTEVGPAEPLARMVDTVREEGTRVGLIHLGPLARVDIEALVSDALQGEPATDLARVCEAKTVGNPFYLRRFLTGLHTDGLLRFESGRWQWDLAAIERQSVTENVVAFMSRQLRRLPAGSLRALQLAACIGTTFDLQTLAALLGASLHEAQLALEPARARDLVHPLDDRYWVGAEDGVTPDFQLAFAHDRVQQAAHEGLTDAEQRAAHLAIGWNLLRTSSERQRARRLFDIVGHLNQGASLISDPAERLEIAELNLAAGKRALASAAYGSAHRCLQVGVGLLGADAWSTAYPLTLDLHVVAAQAAYLATDDTAMDRLVGAVTRHAAMQLDRLRAQEILVYGLIARSELLAAVHKALELLEELGFVLPREPRESDVGAGLGALMARLAKNPPDVIAALPELNDPRVEAARRLMTGVASAAYLTVPPLLPLLAFQLVESTLDDGISRDSAYGFALLALVLAAVKMIDVSYANGKLAMTLLSRWEERSIRVRPTHVFNNMVRFWVDPIRDTLPDLLRNYADGIDTGDVEYGLWTAHCYCYHLFYAGTQLDRVDSEIVGMTQAMRRYRQLAPLAVTTPFAQLVAGLRGRSPDASRIAGEHVDESTAMTAHLGSNYRGAVFVLSTCMVMARVFFRRFDEASELARRYAEYRDGATATMHIASLEFYESIAQLSTADPDVARAEASRDALALWASFNPVSFAHWRITIDAEIARVRGDVGAALDGYDEAIAHAARHGLLGDEALINERAALFHLSRGSRRIARTYLLEARQAYERWGASAKVAHLEQAHADMLIGTGSAHAAGASGSGDLDLEALFRASLAVSEELRLESLLHKVVAVSIQNAAATRGFLVVEREQRLVIEVGIDADEVDLVAAGSPLTGSPELATSVVQYVARTGEQLVLGDAASDRRFSFDPYLQTSGPTSIPCAPLVHKGRRHGTLHLENPRVTGCLPPARLKTIVILAAQAAISIDNAGLVDNLESRVAERTDALEGALQRMRAQHEQLVESQRALVVSDRLAVLGQLVASVAHEINTPMGVILASASNLDAALDLVIHGLPGELAALDAEQVAGWTGLLDDALAARKEPRATREERRTRQRFTETLEAAGVEDAAHTAMQLVEMGLNGDLTPHLPLLRGDRRASLLHHAVELASLRRNTDNVRLAAERASKIVFALKSYAWPGGAKGQVAEGLLTQNLDTVLVLYESQLQQGVELTRHYVDEGRVPGRHEELNQVWMNLVHNALQAMSGKGALEIAVRPEPGDRVRVEVTDDGPGIPAELSAKIFDPFFTTKAAGEGSGLGLAIARDIIEAHGGTISVESRPGRTTFSVILPRQSARAAVSVEPTRGAEPHGSGLGGS